MKFRKRKLMKSALCMALVSAQFFSVFPASAEETEIILDEETQINSDEIILDESDSADNLNLSEDDFNKAELQNPDSSNESFQPESEEITDKSSNEGELVLNFEESAESANSEDNQAESESPSKDHNEFIENDFLINNQYGENLENNALSEAVEISEENISLIGEVISQPDASVAELPLDPAKESIGSFYVADSYYSNMNFGRELANPVINNFASFQPSNWFNYYSTDDMRNFVVGSNIVSVLYTPDDELVVYTFNSSKALISKKKITYPGDLYGTVLHASDGSWYIASGKSNKEENPNAEVVYITKFTSNWTVKGQTVFKANQSNLFQGIVKPFTSAKPSMEEHNGKVYLYMARTMFVHSDGLNHQSDITLCIDSSSMKQVNIKQPYNSHSFNQLVRSSGSSLFYVSHGDAYPRAISITKINSDNSISELNVFDFLGATGENYTGCQIGGFETGSSNNILVGTSVPHNKAVKGVTGYESKLARNIFVVCSNSANTESTFKWLTNYNPSTDNITCGMPELIKINNDRFVLLFSEQSKDGSKTVNRIRYILIDSNGNKYADQIYENLTKPERCSPVYKDSKISWLSYENNNLYWNFIPYLSSSNNFVSFSSNENILLKKNDTFKPQVSYPSSAALNINITSDNTSLASVENQTVKAKAVGSPVVTVKSGSLSSKFTIQVLDLDESPILIENGKSVSRTLQGNINISKISSEKGLLNITNNGKIGNFTGKKTGLDKVTVSVGYLEFEIPVYVYNPADLEIDYNTTKHVLTSQSKHYTSSYDGDMYLFINSNRLYIYQDFTNTNILADDEILARWEVNTSDNNSSTDTQEKHWISYTGKKVLAEIPFPVITDGTARKLILFNRENSGSYFWSYYSVNIYKISGEYYFEEYPISISSDQIKVDSIPDQPFNDNLSKIRPKITVRYKDKVLTENIDYTLVWENALKNGSVDIKGTCSFTGIRFVDFSYIPRIPAGLKAVSSGKKKVFLSWNEVPEAARYLIRTKKNGVDSTLGYAYDNHYDDLNALDTKDNKYWIYAQTYNNGKYVNSGRSQIVTARGVLPAPKNIKAEPKGPNKVKITWDLVEGDVSYYYIKARKNGKDVFVGRASAGRNYFVDTDALDTDTNQYWVYAMHKTNSGSNVCGLKSAVVSCKGVLPSVSNYRGQNSVNGAYMAWNKLDKADGYIVYKDAGDGRGYQKIAILGQNTLKYYDKTASKTSYANYRIKAFHNKNGKRIEGVYSSLLRLRKK